MHVNGITKCDIPIAGKISFKMKHLKQNLNWQERRRCLLTPYKTKEKQWHWSITI